MARIVLYLKGLMGLILLVGLISPLGLAYAQSPTYNFSLIPTYANGKIKYDLRFSSDIEGPVGNLTIKIPLPEGTRFVEASAQPDLTTNFDGTDVTFFSSMLNQPIRNAMFIIEITDSKKTVFTTQAHITWQGEPPGDYLTQDTSLDITRQPLNWAEPANPRLRLRATALVTEGVITYYIYPTNVGTLRMWDLKINVPVPPGTTFLSAEAPDPFVSSFNGQEVSFFTSELERQVELPPLSFKVSTAETTSPFVVTHAWATWKNVGRSVGRTVVPEEDTRSGDIVAQPDVVQQVISDKIGDVPFGNYDLTSVAFQNEGAALGITFYTAGELGPVGEPFQYNLYIDKDCSAETGQPVNDLGRDYLILYRHDKGRANFNIWDEKQKSWTWVQPIKFNNLAQREVVIWLPNELLANSSQFCWQVETKYDTKVFSPNPPKDVTTSARYEGLPVFSDSPANLAALGSLPPLWGYENGAAPSPKPANTAGSASVTTTINGKLAIPLDNGRAHYDIHLFSLPDGRALVKIPNARQPNFRFDGQRLLVNHEGDGVENIFEYNLLDGTEKQVGDAPGDSLPYYDPWGNRVVFGNPELIISAHGTRAPFIFVQCGLMPPHLEKESHCRDIVALGVLAPAGQMGEIQGTNPVWTTDDMIAYKGCNSWAGSSACGIYIVPSSSTKGFSNGFIPRQLSKDTSDTPTDTKGNLIAFMSQRDGNWEAYVMDLNGANVRNLSSSPTSNDGLPTISPDGQWVAFVSDRDGRWAIWVVPVTGGSAQKLFDLPTDIPWGNRDRTWTNERISWGP